MSLVCARLPYALLLAALTTSHALAAVPADTAESGDRSIRAELGVDVDTGRYGTRKRTTVLAADADVDWDFTDTTTLSLGSSYLFQSAPAGSIGGRSPGRLHRGTGAKIVSTSGVGDTTIGVDQLVITQDRGPPLDWGISGELKFGTADVHEGLGTGKTDYTLSSYLAHDWGSLYGKAEIGHSWLGSPGAVTVNGLPENVDYRNVWSASFSADLPLGDGGLLGLEYEQEQAASISPTDRFFPESREIDADLKLPLTRSLKLKGELVKGLSRTSPEWGAGLFLSSRF